jgi:predicted unusual protein kinase regulating ubiquinone biosynthesis (AarF/ABC1/UbiB family)
VAQPRLQKYADIVRLFVRFGGSDLLRGTSAAEYVQNSDSAEVASPSSRPDALAHDLEALGPTFIKLGQLLSTRADLLPQPYLDALARLQDEVKPFSYREVQRIISGELGQPISKLYRSFDREPVAAASLSQVHRAKLRDGRTVAVKVQRPNIRSEVTDDLDTLRKFARLLDKHTDIGRRYEFERTLDEFEKTLFAELDFTQEAQHLVLLKTNLRSFEDIVVPEPVESRTTSRVLTMDYVEGRKVTEANGTFDGPALAEELFTAYLQQILIDGLFHADPHPGNIVVTRDGRIALIDVGMVGRLSTSLREEVLKLILAAADAESRDAADIAIRISEPRDWFDESRFRSSMADLVMRYHDAPVKRIPVGRVVVDMTRIAVDNGLRIVPELTLVAKALLNLDEASRVLDPGFDPQNSIRRNAGRLIQQRLVDAVSPAHVFTSVLETKDFVQTLPSRANRILDALARNELRFKVDLIDEGSVIDGLQKVANRIALGLVLAALILGAALLMRIQTPFTILGYPGFAILCFLGAAAGGVWLAFTIVARDRSPATNRHSKRVT